MPAQQPRDPFALRPPRAARVSELSEMTAASGVSPDERVDFHIGNPVQDPRLLGLYQRLVCGLPADARPLPASELETFAAREGLPPRATGELALLCRAAEDCVAYLPRGGFHAARPGTLAPLVRQRLAAASPEALSYGLGLSGDQEDSGADGPRELTFANGGRAEALRILLSALGRALVHGPADVSLVGLPETPHLAALAGVRLRTVPPDAGWLSVTETQLESSPGRPHVLVLGASLDEAQRRALWRLLDAHPLLLVEANDAPNQRSLARESGLADRVLRLLSPAALGPGGARAGRSVVVLAGSARLVALFETEHFQLKGTPSGAEMALADWALSNRPDGPPAAPPAAPQSGQRSAPETSAARVDGPPPVTAGPRRTDPAAIVARLAGAQGAVGRMEELAARLAERAGGQVAERAAATLERVARPRPLRQSAGATAEDPLASFQGHALLARLLGGGAATPSFLAELEASFLAAFLSHHPEYVPAHCVALSGSARTALGLLGFHCGIREVITPDLSWTYHHCFPQVHAVPLRPDLHLDGPALVAAVEDRIAQSPGWRERGAVVLNTPHNASGQVFRDADLETLVRRLLELGVRVVDDLSYDDVGPTPPGERALPGRRTIRRIAGDLVRCGAVPAHRLRLLTTVHSLSKTDAFAGGRLAVVEVGDEELRERFQTVARTIAPNGLALTLATLFLRRSPAEVRGYWALRNEILGERMEALSAAAVELPPERNPYAIEVRRPAGAMYPQLVVGGLPDGVSLDWLSTGLARRGIGILPLTTFARTARGFDLARRTFRLTLGGRADAGALGRKMRRVLIDLNRLIAQESARYGRRPLPTPAHARRPPRKATADEQAAWRTMERRAAEVATDRLRTLALRPDAIVDGERAVRRFEREHLPQRLKQLRGRFHDAAILTRELLTQADRRGGGAVIDTLERELTPQAADERAEAFRRRTFDRTVHPTQMYSLRVDQRTAEMTDAILLGESVPRPDVLALGRDLAAEYLGTNVPIDSRAESGELVADLRALLQAEEWARVWHDVDRPTLLSFWGDWDGSTRPSGQGHRLVAGALLAGAMQLAELLRAVAAAGAPLQVGDALSREAERLGRRSEDFWALLNEITALTTQLEARYQRFLPFDLRAGRLRQLGMRLGLMRSPLVRSAQHNDRLERRMLALRDRRRDGLDDYLRLGAALRAALRDNLDVVRDSLGDRRVAFRAGWYRDLLRRFVLTPRVHQRMVLARDPFSIDTTVFNIAELNRLACAHGLHGFVLGLQVSHSDTPEAFVTLDRKLRAARDATLRGRSPDAGACAAGNGAAAPPHVCVIPLFEEPETVRGLTGYLEHVWRYAGRSRGLGQEPAERFAEMACEIFVAGSDLSQQASQPAGEALFREAKLKTVRWLAERGLVDRVRLKLGSGEPAQRQAGYYDPLSGRPAVHDADDARQRLAENLSEPARRAAETALTPLEGVTRGGELRTWQSNLAEHLRRLRAGEHAALLHHVRGQQRNHDATLTRAAAVLRDTRLRFRDRGIQELDLLTRGPWDERYGQFLTLVERNFRHILYGRPEDVVGIHAISYFLSRAVPPLRDRPVVRPSRDLAQQGGRAVLGRVAQTLPLARHGSLLRAIGHNRSQTTLLGVNQLSTGLFRALSEFVEQNGAGSEGVVADVVLPRLPVRDLLRTLRRYHDPTMHWVRRLETVFPAGNSALVALREDNETLPRFIGALQRELVRRAGLHAEEFVEGRGSRRRVRAELLPALRPDLAVLLQPDLWNTDPERLFAAAGGAPDEAWRAEVSRLLSIPTEVQRMREQVWQVLETPVRNQVESFVELTRALYTLIETEGVDAGLFGPESRKLVRLRSELSHLLRSDRDDAMRQFLAAAVQFLTQVPGNLPQVPVEVVRALHDVRRIVRIESQALSDREQALVRFQLLRIARLCGENG